MAMLVEGSEITAMRRAFMRAIIKRVVRRHKELKKQAVKPRVPLYDDIYFEGLKWLNSR